MAGIKQARGVEKVTNNVRGIIVVGLCSMGGVQARVRVAGVMVQVLQQQQQPLSAQSSHHFYALDEQPWPVKQN